MITMRILVIDDEAHIRKTTTMTLDALGHECAQAHNSAGPWAFCKRRVSTRHFSTCASATRTAWS